MVDWSGFKLLALCVFSRPLDKSSSRGYLTYHLIPTSVSACTSATAMNLSEGPSLVVQ